MTVFLLAGGLFARGEKEEGWEKFGQAMEIYARWQSFPADAKLELGSAELFDGFLLTRIEGYLTKSAETRIEIRDGALYAYDLQQVDNMTIQEVFFPPFSVSDILRNHPAFASVREDERLIRALEWLESDDSR